MCRKRRTKSARKKRRKRSRRAKKRNFGSAIAPDLAVPGPGPSPGGPDPNRGLGANRKKTTRRKRSAPRADLAPGILRLDWTRKSTTKTTGTLVQASTTEKAARIKTRTIGTTPGKVPQIPNTTCKICNFIIDVKL